MTDGIIDFYTRRAKRLASHQPDNDVIRELVYLVERLACQVRVERECLQARRMYNGDANSVLLEAAARCSGFAQLHRQRMLQSTAKDMPTDEWFHNGQMVAYEHMADQLRNIVKTHSTAPLNNPTTQNNDTGTNTKDQ